MTTPKKGRKALPINTRTRMYTREDGTQIPVVDAKDPIALKPTEAERQRARPQSFTECMYALAARRMFGADRFIVAWIGRNTAYVELDDELRRYMVQGPIRERIKSHDEGQLEDPKILDTVVLLPPKGSQTLNGKEARYVARKAAIKGKRKPANPRKPFTWRNGTGLVHFS